MSDDEQISIGKAILVQEVTILRNRLRESGADFDVLTDSVIAAASWKQLREWKSDFNRLLRTLSAGGGR